MNPTTRAYLRARRDYDQAPSAAITERALDYANALEAYRAAGWPDADAEPETGALFREWQREAEDQWSAKEAALIAALDAARAETDLLALRLGERDGELRAARADRDHWRAIGEGVMDLLRDPTDPNAARLAMVAIFAAKPWETP